MPFQSPLRRHPEARPSAEHLGVTELARFFRRATFHSFRMMPRLILHVEPPEFLDPLPGVHFRGVDVASPVDRDVMDGHELPGLASDPAEASDRLLRCAIDDS